MTNPVPLCLRRKGALLLGVLALLGLPTGISAQNTSPSRPRVLQVGTYQGKAGQYSTIQDAVNAAHPGDWILIGPGDYHEQGTPAGPDPLAGVLITTPGLHLRGMDRNRVLVDGTLPGSKPCSSDRAAQNFGRAATATTPGGRNGVEVFQVAGVSIENLTVCNFLGDINFNNGNQIWWNGGDGSGSIGMDSYLGRYLTATSTFFDPNNPTAAAQYGIFASNAKGPGVIEYSYAGNMGDSGFYIGACQDCNAVIRFVHAQNNAQGFSGSNAGGRLVLEDSEWDNNQTGILPSSLALFDLPSPQDGACPEKPGASCTLIHRNYIHDNNNPNSPVVPSSLQGSAPIGTGIDLSGGRNNTVEDNLIVNNGSWGVLVNDFADYSGQGIAQAPCLGGEPHFNPPSDYARLYSPLPIPCYFPAFGNRLRDNVFLHNGFFRNPTNGDLANVALPYPVNNCFTANLDVEEKLTSSPEYLENPAVAGTCGKAWNPDTAQEILLTEELGCASLGGSFCTGVPGPGYPRQSQVQMLPIPNEPGMADPCQGVPQNSWCP